LERDKNALELEELASECLQNIGALIEGAAKPYLIDKQNKGRTIDGWLHASSA
jgi:hypothetical protein